MTPPQLFGFMPNTSMNEKLHDLLKGIMPYSKPFTVVVKKSLLFLENLLSGSQRFPTCNLVSNARSGPAGKIVLHNQDAFVDKRGLSGWRPN